MIKIIQNKIVIGILTLILAVLVYFFLEYKKSRQEAESRAAQDVKEMREHNRRMKDFLTH